MKFELKDYVQKKCHHLQDKYGTKYIFVSIAAVVGANIFLSSLIYLAAEPGIHNWFDSIYWTVTTLSTVGYGDITPVTIIGKLVAMFNMVIGIALFPMFGGMIVGIIQSILQKKTDVANAELQKQNALAIEQNARIEKNQERIIKLLEAQAK